MASAEDPKNRFDLNRLALVLGAFASLAAIIQFLVWVWSVV